MAYILQIRVFKSLIMKKYIFRPGGVFFLVTLTFIMALARLKPVEANSSIPAHVQGYAGHENNQNNWGLFGIIGVIALAGITKRSVEAKNE